MSDYSVCCAHIIVTYVHEHNKDGTTRGWWQCCDCGKEFHPQGPCHAARPSHLHDKLEALWAELRVLKGDLNIALLERDAKLCSQCPRTPELARVREALSDLLSLADITKPYPTLTAGVVMRARAALAAGKGEGEKHE